MAENPKTILPEKYHKAIDHKRKYYIYFSHKFLCQNSLREKWTSLLLLVIVSNSKSGNRFWLCLYDVIVQSLEEFVATTKFRW